MDFILTPEALARLHYTRDIAENFIKEWISWLPEGNRLLETERNKILLGMFVFLVIANLIAWFMNKEYFAQWQRLKLE